MKRILCYIIIVLTTLLFLGCGGQQQAEKPAELHISAAVSLKDALGEIQNNYKAKHPNITFVNNLGASGSLARQIENGAPADIFVSAAAKQMDDLALKNLINNGSRKIIVSNELVVIVPRDSTLAINSFGDLAKPELEKIGIGETAVVPAGQYAKEVLQNLSIWNEVQQKAVQAKDVRTVLAYVETGNVQAGIVYKSDAAGNDKVKVKAFAPEGSHQPIIYPAAIIANSQQQKAAEDFLNYLAGSECAPVFEKYGFKAVKSQ